MNVGALNQFITIESVTETRDSMGGLVQTWATFIEAWASIEPTTGREFFKSGMISAQITHAIKIRYRSGVVPKMRMKFGTRYFNIVYVLNWKERNVYFDLLCTEFV